MAWRHLSSSMSNTSQSKEIIERVRMSVVIITGSGGLIGSAAVNHYCDKGADVIGVDCDARAQFFGAGSSVRPMIDQLIARHSNYQHIDMDIRDQDSLNKLFKTHGHNISLIVHTAAQPSHDWAASEPITDFTINALATLYLLEAFRAHCPEACFVFTSRIEGTRRSGRSSSPSAWSRRPAVSDARDAG